MSVVFVELTDEERMAVVWRMRVLLDREEALGWSNDPNARDALRKLEDAEPHGRETVR